MIISNSKNALNDYFLILKKKIIPNIEYKYVIKYIFSMKEIFKIKFC